MNLVTNSVYYKVSMASLAALKLDKLNGKLMAVPATYADSNGLTCIHNKNGVLNFYLRLQLNGKPVKMKIGIYGDADNQLSLAQARDMAVAYKALSAAGQDPRIAHKGLLSAQLVTVNDAFDSWYKKEAKQHIASHKALKARYDRYISGEIGGVNLASLKRLHIINMVESAQVNHSDDTARRLLELTKQVLRWYSHRDEDFNNPASDIKAGYFRIKVNKVDRYLSEHEVQVYLQVLPTVGLHQRTKIYYELLLLTGCRGGELRQALVSHVDLDKAVWTVPTHINKLREKGGDIIRPLSDRALELFRQLIDIANGDDMLFRSRQGKNKGMITQSALNNQASTLIKAMQAVDPSIKHFTPHDIRRTFRTLIAPMVRHEVAESMLGHLVSGVVGVYERTDWMKQKAAGYQRWSDCLNNKSGNVVCIRSA